MPAKYNYLCVVSLSRNTSFKSEPDDKYHYEVVASNMEQAREKVEEYIKKKTFFNLESSKLSVDITLLGRNYD